ncbi:hypothetical protein [Roseomonas indoligenes]|uniref:Uncharacterized protein n=1 Tax=Roseomonas indoligenes TaxID=2820811 RepID=A0A940MZ55_9PROT|nr:hypothetical protein [Pararoseomonas indoligenes]MBP0491347.1 hypothetical protein [Pararoseomonas indoligenes]
MPYLAEAILFLAPFALYALWLRFNPGRAVATHVIALAVAGLVVAIGGAIFYGLSRGRSPTTLYVPPRIEADGPARPVPPARAP